MESQVLIDCTEDDGTKLVLEKFDKDGFLFEREQSVLNGSPRGQGLLVAVSNCGRRIELGQLVVSNGRFSVPRGRRGIVIRINLLYEKGRTSDILEVHFEGDHYPSIMKLKDLEFE